MKKINYIFTLKAHNTPGVLARIAQVLARRNCHINSLDMQQEDNSWTTLKINIYNVLRPDQIQLQLEKLVDIDNVVMRIES